MTTKKNAKANMARNSSRVGLKQRALVAMASLPMVAACAGEALSTDGVAGDVNPAEEIGTSESALTASDFMKTIPGTSLSTVSGARDLLIVCMDKGTTDPMPTLATIQAVAGQVQAFFRENSRGRFTIGNVMYRGCGGSTGSYKSSSVDPPVPQQWTEALNQAAAAGFNFNSYDKNNNGNISGNELGIAVIRQTPANWDYGTERTATFQASGKTMTANIADIYFSAGTKTVQWGLLSHELMHDYANAADLYSDGTVTMWRPGWYSLMDAHWNANHVDPIHKLKWGWTNPTVLTLLPRTFFVGPVESSGNITILADRHGSKEYFVIENRSFTAGAFDANLPQQGVLVWRVVEDTTLASTYSPTRAIERWGWQLLTPGPLQPGQSFDLPWLEGATGYQLAVISQTGGTAKVSVTSKSRTFFLPVAIPSANVDFFEAAAESGSFVVGQTGRYVAFGARDDSTKWTYKYLGAGTYTCSTSVMGGDPDYGVPKACYFANLRRVVNEEYGSNTCPSGQVCISNLIGSTSKPATYAFGANGKFTFKTFTDSTYRKCSTTTFGSDPISGVSKACYAVLPGYTYAAKESTSAVLTGLNNTPVAFGANGKYAFAIKSGSVACSAASIGDPDISGTQRHCYILDSGKSYLGGEGSTFSFNSSGVTCPVQYTSGRNGNVGLISQCSGSCTNSTFGGDPDWGYAKACYGTPQAIIR